MPNPAINKEVIITKTPNKAHYVDPNLQNPLFLSASDEGITISKETWDKLIPKPKSPPNYNQSLTPEQALLVPQTKKTKLSKNLDLFIKCFQYVNRKRLKILSPISYCAQNQLIYFSTQSNNHVLILELSLSNPKAHLRLRYLTPKTKGLKNSYSTSYHLYPITNITTYIKYLI